MDVSLIADTAAVAAAQGLGFANSISHCNNLIANSHHLSAVIFDAIAPPTVKSSSVRTVRRNRVRRRRRTRRKTYGAGESDEGGDAGEELGFYGGDGGGPIGGGGGSWGSGGGWNFYRYGGQNWDESSWFGSSEFAYGFVYEVIYWIALSTCLHFALGKVVRMMSGGIGDGGREKGSMRLVYVC